MPPSKIALTLTPDSSQLHGHGFENGTLALEFNSNHGNVTYHYPGFGQERYDAFLAAESKGSHFYKHIKNQFPDGSFERHYKEDQPTESEGGEAT